MANPPKMAAMATVELSFTPLPAHVRTARLVATAVARRSGVEESLLDEVRLAVGEACSRAVEAHRLHCPAEPVRIQLSDRDGRFEVVVTDAVPGGVDDAAAMRAALDESAARAPVPPTAVHAGERAGTGGCGHAQPERPPRRRTVRPRPAQTGRAGMPPMMWPGAAARARRRGRRQAAPAEHDAAPTVAFLPGSGSP